MKNIVFENGELGGNIKRIEVEKLFVKREGVNLRIILMVCLIYWMVWVYGFSFGLREK